MCVIVYKPKSQKIKMKNLKNCSDTNPDGIGIVIRKNNRTIMKKGILFSELEEIVKNNEKEEMVIHFRIATHGSISKKNCHPFIFTSNENESFFLFHNGILRINTENDFTDSETFAKNYLQDQSLDQIKKYITLACELSSSKMIIISEKNFFSAGNFLLNEGIYFSNSSYKNRIEFEWKEFSGKNINLMYNKKIK